MVLVLASGLCFRFHAYELVAAMQRLPTWQDLQYLADPAFVHKQHRRFQPRLPLVL
jgi:hypothetical protein